MAENNKEIGDRLRLTFDALGLSQIEFARRADIRPQAMNNAVRGRSRIGLDSALRLCRTYGLSLPWIYDGELSTLPHVLATRIIELQRQATRKKPTRRS